MQIEVFGKQSCAKCETTKHKIEHFMTKLGVAEKVAFTFHDMDTVDGMTEGAFRDVFDIPTTIIQRDGQDLVRWAGEIPPTAGIKDYLGTA
jgi:thiol-disulfide isomerase/thioredoxin